MTMSTKAFSSQNFLNDKKEDNATKNAQTERIQSMLMMMVVTVVMMIVTVVMMIVTVLMMVVTVVMMLMMMFMCMTRAVRLSSMRKEVQEDITKKTTGGESQHRM